MVYSQTSSRIQAIHTTVSQQKYYIHGIARFDSTRRNIFQKMVKNITTLLSIASIVFHTQISYAEEVTQSIPRYNRMEYFGSWKDFDKDCQSSREELLIKNAVNYTLNQSGCNVVYGTWYLPYTNEKYTGNDSILHADHIVPLSFAWKHGAYKWTQAKREMFANDLDNLIISNPEVNIAKSDKGINEWLPPYKPFQCEYVKRFMFVAKKYKLENIQNNTQCKI